MQYLDTSCRNKVMGEYIRKNSSHTRHQWQHSSRPIFHFNMLFATVISCLSFIACGHARALDSSAVAGVGSTVKPLAQHTSSPSPTSISSPLCLETPAVDVQATSEASDDASYWLADITHQGIAAFNPNPSTYKVFRNVMDYGAKGNTRQHVGHKKIGV